IPNPYGKYWRASVVELLPDPLSPLFASLGLTTWSRATEGLLKDIGMTGLMSDDLLITINGYAYYGMIFKPLQTIKFVLIFPYFFVIFIPFLRSAQTRWREAHSRYAEVVSRWQTMDLATTSAADLLNGAREITAEAAR